jgi:hypothetical protein
MQYETLKEQHEELLTALQNLFDVTPQNYDNRHELAAAREAIDEATGGEWVWVLFINDKLYGVFNDEALAIKAGDDYPYDSPNISCHYYAAKVNEPRTNNVAEASPDAL